MDRHRREIDRIMHESATSWKALQVVRMSARMLSLVVFGILLIGVAASLEWLRSEFFAGLSIGVLVCLGGITWFIRCILAIDRNLSRRQLAGSIEARQAPLLDRLNTIVELDEQLDSNRAAVLRNAIEQQACSVMAASREKSTFSLSQASRPCLIAFVTCLLTMWFYSHFDPFGKLEASLAVPDEPVPDASSVNIPGLPPDPESDPLMQEPEGPWGEIRISQPGANLRITVAEDVPLMIEAAASQAISRIQWMTQVNDEAEVIHELPPSEDPRYAVYKPVIDPITLGLAEWDVLEYRASFFCDDGPPAESLTYFIEIVPSRDRIDDLPGNALQSLEQLTELVEQQQQVIRETELYVQNESDAAVDLQQQLSAREDAVRQSLAMVELSLRRFLEGKGKERGDEFFSTVKLADEFLESAAEKLVLNAGSAIEPERNALQKLGHARRVISELARDFPEMFEPTAAESVGMAIDRQDLKPLSDDDFANLLKRLREEQELSVAARQSLDELVSRQKSLADRLDAEALSDATESVARAESDQIRQRFGPLADDIQRLMPELAPQLKKTERRLAEFHDALSQADEQAALQARRAHEALSRLRDSVASQNLFQQVMEEEALLQRLNVNISEYNRIEKNPGSMDDSEITGVTNDTGRLLDELRDLSDRNSARSSEVPEDPKDINSSETRNTEYQDTKSHLQQTLTPELESELRAKCDELSRNPESDRIVETAGLLRAGLQRLADSLKQDRQLASEQLKQAEVETTLDSMEERRDEIESAREFVQSQRARQQSLKQRAEADRSRQSSDPAVTQGQQQLRENVGRFRDRRSDLPEDVDNGLDSAEQAMQRAEESLKRKDSAASQQMARAIEELQFVDEALARTQDKHDLVDQSRLRESMQRTIQQLQKMEMTPTASDPEERRKIAGQCVKIAAQCQKAGSGSGGTGGGLSPLEEATNPRKVNELQQRSNDLANASGESRIKAASRSMKEAMQELAEAFDRTFGGSNPQGTGPASSGFPGASGQAQNLPGRPGQGKLQTKGHDAINRGMRQLESAARQQSGSQNAGRTQQLRRGAVADLSAGITSEYGNNDGTRIVLQQVRRDLSETATPVSADTLGRLREAISRLQADRRPVVLPDTGTEESSNVDSSRFPPEYRESIRRYFEALSEKK